MEPSQSIYILTASLSITSVPKGNNLSLPVGFVRAHISVDMSTLWASETKIAEFANSIDPDEAAHNEPPYLYLQCLSSTLSMI